MLKVNSVRFATNTKKMIVDGELETTGRDVWPVMSIGKEVII